MATNPYLTSEQLKMCHFGLLAYILDQIFKDIVLAKKQ